ncbi:MAG: glycine--tRNA ligase subunit beta [Nitrospiraceae bacterium]|nr:glycine--tRNA ligase subunit beta [Nitrospiraceae bacterium]
MTQASGTPKKKNSRVPSAELLVEVGTEELPYQFIEPALSTLKEQAERLFMEARLSHGVIRTYGTPRRLTLVVAGLAVYQAPIVKEAMGPSKTVAFDAAGQPTKAAIGFAAGQGVPVDQLEVRQTPKGAYLFAVKQDAGRPTGPVLCDLVPRLIETLSFPKAMKWNEAGVRFARPVRWLVALFAGEVLPVEAAGIRAGHHTYGHRVMSHGKPLAVRNAKTYVESLARHGVLVDPMRRRAAIEEQLDRLCRDAGVTLNADAALLDQAVYTTEWPCAILGSFKPEYLTVPGDILMTSMKEHQGFFSVRDRATGQLAPHFIAVANIELKDMDLIRAGNERVLAARLADAKFFFDEDRKVSLQTRAKKLGGVTLHQKLGTMAQKQERVTILAGLISDLVDPPQPGLRPECERAAALCKADLLTGIVGEFPELQGIMGGAYAEHDGESPVVSRAIREQYLPRSLEGDLPKTVEGQVLSLADRLDSLAAFFYVGIVPTGSEDPFGLRRHATALVRILVEGATFRHFGQAVQKAQSMVSAAGFKAAPVPSGDGAQRLTDFVLERLRHYGRTVHGLRDDVMNAVVSVADRQMLDLRDLVARMKALQDIAARAEFDPLIVGFKRAHRLVEKESWDRTAVDPGRFEHSSERDLYSSLEKGRDMTAHVKAGRYQEAMEVLVSLKPAIDAFFEAVMVNADDPVIRTNRLSLLKDVDELFMSFADFSQIVVQGS